ncbi:MAG TPA: aldo/keto reductase [Candidatus Acidoferrales bacterium]|nr:aldo/keto reductase [Candidatus Acidoferrales bacterium]
MRYRTLGRTSLQVSEIAHGLWGMGMWTDSDDSESLAALQLAADLGCNFFDTAWAYGEGKSDSLLGRTLAKNSGKKLVAASKVPPKNRKWPASSKDSYRDVFPSDYVLESARQICKTIGVETIDLLQFHVWDDSWAGDPDFRRAVEQLKKLKLIRFFGLSLNRWEPENGIAAIRTGLVDVVQVIYNIFDQAPEDELFPLCIERSIGVIARVPLDEGSLGGKMTRETRFPENDWRSRYFNPKNLAETMDRVDAISKLLPPKMSLPEMSLRFILSHKAVSTIIIGMRKAEHVRANLAASDAGPLDAALIEKLRAHRWDRKPTPWSA